MVVGCVSLVGFEGFRSVYAYNELEKDPGPQRASMLHLIEKYIIIVLDTSEEVVQLAESYEHDLFVGYTPTQDGVRWNAVTILLSASPGRAECE